MASFENAVRPFQLPQSASSQLYLSQSGIASQPFVILTPGFGGDLGGEFPPIMTGNGSSSYRITYYCDMAANEQAASEG